MNNVKHSEERLMKVLLAPVISEKATFVAEKNEQVVFLVAPDANKLEIKAAVGREARRDGEGLRQPEARSGNQFHRGG